MATILAIESSCDETSIAITRDGKLLSNIVSTQIAIHEKYGGVMPEIASRLHTENISVVLKEALETANIKMEDVDAIAVTRGPGLIGALHVGMQAAKTLAMLYNKPLIPVHHLTGHIYANEYVDELHFPLLAVVVSGGNTEFVLMKDHLSFDIIAETRDDAIGESFDKVARVLGLPYPGGVHIERHALNGKHTYNLPTPLKGEDTLEVSFSGLKTNVINMVHKMEQNNEQVNVDDMCKSFQDVATNLIANRVDKIIDKYDIKEVLLAGGVSANKALREVVKDVTDKHLVKLHLPPMWCCTDNAAMIAKVAEHLYEQKLFADLDISVDPNWRIEDYRKF